MTNLPNMRIKQITVKKLFGLFDHVIPLNMEERITIIHGPNGFGKTILLRMLHGLFNGHYTIFRTIPFKEFQVIFEDGDYIKVDFPRQKERKDSNFPKLTFHKLNSSDKPPSMTLAPRNLEPMPFLSDLIEHEIPNMERVGINRWQDRITGEILSIGDITERFGHYLPSRYINANVKDENLREEIREKIHIQFIKTQRSLSLSRLPKSRDKSPQMVAAVTIYADDLATTIKTKLAESSQLSQSLDRTFPARLVSLTNNGNKLQENELRDKLTQLESKRSRFKAVGLLEKEEDNSFQIPQHIDEHTKNVLAVYVQDVEQKLAIFDELAEKIESFQQIIKNRFLYKKITIGEEEGFFFSTHDGQRLAVTDLSSGEQQELILLYELLFKTKPNSLILIDEPEISLHIAWQTQFIRDLEAITKLGSFDILVATHSPDIISNRWDLTVELKGPEMSMVV